MLSVYPACFFKEENGYSVIFPDLNYLATCGESLEESLEMAIDCLAGYLYSCKMEGIIAPLPSHINEINIAEVAKEMELGIESVENFVNMVTVDVEDYAKNHFEKPVKKTLTIPSWLNDTAQEKGVNFSAVLQDALKERLGL